MINFLTGDRRLRRMRDRANEAAMAAYDPSVFEPARQQTTQQATQGIPTDRVRQGALASIFRSAQPNQLSLFGGDQSRAIAGAGAMDAGRATAMADAETRIGLADEQARLEGQTQLASILGQQRETIGRRDAAIAQNEAMLEAERSRRRGQLGMGLLNLGIAAFGPAIGSGIKNLFSRGEQATDFTPVDITGSSDEFTEGMNLLRDPETGEIFSEQEALTFDPGLDTETMYMQGVLGETVPGGQTTPIITGTFTEREALTFDAGLDMDDFVPLPGDQAPDLSTSQDEILPAPDDTTQPQQVERPLTREEFRRQGLIGLSPHVSVPILGRLLANQARNLDEWSRDFDRRVTERGNEMFNVVKQKVGDFFERQIGISGSDYFDYIETLTPEQIEQLNAQQGGDFVDFEFGTPEQPFAPTPSGTQAEFNFGVQRPEVTTNFETFSQQFPQIESEYGLPEGYLTRTAQIESSSGTNLLNEDTGASGVFQFLSGTASDFGLDYGELNTFAQQGQIDSRELEAIGPFTQRNIRQLQRALGRYPTPGEIYLAHQQGGGGASRLLRNPNALAASIVTADAVRLNGGDPNTMTAGEFAQLWISKFEQQL